MLNWSFYEPTPKINYENYTIAKTYGSIIYIWHSNYICSREFLLLVGYIYNLQYDL